MKELHGIFDGKFMVAEDGEKYPVPESYASKSRMLEGDGLSLVIKDNDELIFKMINPIHRIRAIKKIQEDKKTKELYILHEDRKYKLSDCVINYYELKAGSKVIAILPKFLKNTEWASIDGVIQK
jgi:hypothetical protein